MRITITNSLNLVKDCQQTIDGRFFIVFSLVKKMFPDKVYYCPCLKIDVMMCLVNGDYCLKDIIRKLKKCQAKRVFFCTKCGNDKHDVIFSCVDHMRLKTFLVGDGHLSDDHRNNCKQCLKKYLRTAYSCCYQHTKFDVPLQMKKEKKVLCLRLTKL